MQYAQQHAKNKAHNMLIAVNYQGIPQKAALTLYMTISEGIM